MGSWITTLTRSHPLIIKTDKTNPLSLKGEIVSLQSEMFNWIHIIEQKGRHKCNDNETISNTKMNGLNPEINFDIYADECGCVEDEHS